MTTKIKNRLDGTTRKVFEIGDGSLDFSLVINPYSLVFPLQQGAVGQTLVLDGAGKLQWTTPATGGGTPTGSPNTVGFFDAAGLLSSSTEFAYTGKNLYIGTGTPVDFGTQKGIQIGRGTIEGVSNNGSLRLMSNISYDGSIYKSIDTGYGSMIMLGWNEMYFYGTTPSAGTPGTTVSLNEYMRLGSSGMAIGLSYADAKLHVRESGTREVLRLEGTTLNGARIAFTQAATVRASLGFDSQIATNQDLSIKNLTATGTIKFLLNNVERVQITVAGNVVSALAPTADDHLANKLYVDTAVAGVGGGGGAYVPLAGGDMTGPLTISIASAQYALAVLNGHGASEGHGLSVITRWNTSSNIVARFATNSGSNDVLTLYGNQSAVFAGNLGIGLIPTYKLDVLSTSQTIANFKSSDTTSAFVRFADGSADRGYIGSGSSVLTGMVATDFGITGGPGAKLVFGANNAESFRVATDLRIQIGNTDKTNAKLNVTNGISNYATGSDSADSNKGIYSFNSAATFAGFGLQLNAANNFSIFVGNNSTNWIERLRLTKTGHVETSGQLRAGGWYDGSTVGAYNGLGVEIGVSGTDGYLVSYNRSNSTYGSLNIHTSIVNIAPGGIGLIYINTVGMAIGTSSITAKLNISGAAVNSSPSNISGMVSNSLLFRGNNSGAGGYAGLTYESGGGGGAAILFNRDGSYGTAIRFYTNSASTSGAISEKMSLSSAGVLSVPAGISATTTNAINLEQTAGLQNNWNAHFDTTTLPGYLSWGESSAGGPTGDWYFGINLKHSNATTDYGVQWAIGWQGNLHEFYTRRNSGNTWSSWARYVNNSNYLSAIPTMFADRGTVPDTSLNSATSNGHYSVTYTGYSMGMLVFNAGGSCGPVQLRFAYQGNMWFRNMTDSSSWTAWKEVITNINIGSQTVARAGTAGGVDNYPNRTDTASYPIVWTTAGGTPPTYSCAAVTIKSSEGAVNATTFYAASWFRSYGASGWYNQDYAVGIYATETGRVRTYNGATFMATRYERSNWGTGYLDGGYQNLGPSEGKTNPIFCIGTSYAPSETAVGSWYGVGYDNGYLGVGSGWGLSTHVGGVTKCRIGENLWHTGDIVAYASDERLKTNIKTIDNALSKVESIRGVEFDWLPDIQETHGWKPSVFHETGVIAQDIQQVIPDAVLEAPMNMEATRHLGVDNHYLTVNKEKIIPLLIEAIKELSELNKDLTRRLRILEGDLR